MWRFLRNLRLILRLHYYLGTHILGASRGGPCDSTALVMSFLPHSKAQIFLPVILDLFLKHQRNSSWLF